MKLVKTSAIAVAISALLAGPVLAQGASSDTQIRGGAQGKTQMQGGTSGSSDGGDGCAGGRGRSKNPASMRRPARKARLGPAAGRPRAPVRLAIPRPASATRTRILR